MEKLNGTTSSVTVNERSENVSKHHDYNQMVTNFQSNSIFGNTLDLYALHIIIIIICCRWTSKVENISAAIIAVY